MNQNLYEFLALVAMSASLALAGIWGNYGGGLAAFVIGGFLAIMSRAEAPYPPSVDLDDPLHLNMSTYVFPQYVGDTVREHEVIAVNFDAAIESIMRDGYDLSDFGQGYKKEDT